MQSRFHKYLALALLLLLSCGRQGSNGHKDVYVSADGEANPNSKGNPDSPDGNPESATKAGVDFLPLTGSSMRLIDSRGLTVKYSRVFAKEEFGFQHCKKDRPRTFAFCVDSIFAPAERIFMGTYDIFSANGQRGTSNVNRNESLTLNYLRSLRAGLARECRVLVEKELAALDRGDKSKNVFVQAEEPTAASAERFAKIIMGLGTSPIAIDIGAAEYVAAFKQSIAAAKDPVKARQEAHTALCVALAMDPQIIFY